MLDDSGQLYSWSETALAVASEANSKNSDRSHDVRRQQRKWSGQRLPHPNHKALTPTGPPVFTGGEAIVGAVTPRTLQQYNVQNVNVVEKHVHK